MKQLQHIDTQTKDIRQSIEAIPAQLNPAKQDLQKLETMLVGERKQIDETEIWRKDQEDIVEREEEALVNAKSKLAEAKNSRDFGAASREIDNKKRSIHDREQEILKVYEALERGRAKLTTHEEDVAKLRTHVEGEEAKFSESLSSLTAQVEEISAGRSDIESQIKPEFLKRYNVVMQRRGSAIAAVVDGVCQGCHMGLAPQLGIQVARGDSLHSCRQCNRLLYIPEPPPETDEDQSEAS
ncbi:MAG: hypothetical protein JKY56_21895 [Kofleriaceae bacterium]|nr:hypothetical protein [Kofleriaceae bacterium]